MYYSRHNFASIRISLYTCTHAARARQCVCSVQLERSASRTGQRPKNRLRVIGTKASAYNSVQELANAVGQKQCYNSAKLIHPTSSPAHQQRRCKQAVTCM